MGTLTGHPTFTISIRDLAGQLYQSFWMNSYVSGGYPDHGKYDTGTKHPAERLAKPASIFLQPP